MKLTKIFGLSFTFMFISTALLCIIYGLPLTLGRVDYSLFGFIRLGLLVAFLSFCLVFINLSVLKWIKPKILIRSNDIIYYMTSTVIILQVVTLITGYLESMITRGVEADFLYYYKCVTNSCIYILTGNITAIIASRLYAKMIK